MIFETVLFPCGRGVNERGYRTACPDYGSGPILGESPFSTGCRGVLSLYSKAVLYLGPSKRGDAWVSGGLWWEYKWVVLTVTTVGIFMATLDSSILVVGLPQVVVELNTNWVVGVWLITI